MPSTKKRINLTVSDKIYERIQTYKAENGLENDATACLQLIVRQLNAEKEARTMLDFMDLVKSVDPKDYESTYDKFMNAIKKQQ
ncbi:MAG: hypothetical protein E7425_01475 [Ruminococcaceae bacterium]|nr:hypothetical protein [Oscillospiraceae bacterium]